MTIITLKSTAFDDGDHERRFKIGQETYGYKVEPDDNNDAPWTREDGHGAVLHRRDYVAREGDGMRVLRESHSGALLYDFEGTLAVAERDWVKKTPARTLKSRARKAVQADFERLRAWVAGEWHYVGVTVWFKCAHCGSRNPDHKASLWGIESDADEAYRLEVLADLASEAGSP